MCANAPNRFIRSSVARLAALLFLLTPALAVAQRPRIFVLTDISSLTAGVREPDDGQSLIRLLLHSNEFDIEGIVASSNMRHGQVVRPELALQAIDAYAEVHSNLLLHDRRFPQPSALRTVVKAGQPLAGPDTPYSESVGAGKDTPGSQWLIEVAGKPGPRPLWVLIWGGSADLAQALWRVRHDRSPAQQQAFASKLRVHSIYDQDSTGAVIKQEWPDLFYVTRNHGIRGMYRSGDSSLVSSQWVATHANEGHGPLGALYPNYRGGDIWARTLGPVHGVKEGDTPSFLSLFPNGLNRPDRPDLGGWGGRMVAEDARGLRWKDAADGDAAPDDPDPRMSAVYRWRSDFQNEMQARLDWCVQPPNEANHPPVVRVVGRGSAMLRHSAIHRFDASGSVDPDGHALDFDWSIYPPAPGSFRVEAMSGGRAVLRVPEQGELPQSISIVLRVRDRGTPPLSRYVRVELKR